MGYTELKCVENDKLKVERRHFCNSDVIINKFGFAWALRIKIRSIKDLV